jgi:hypothetical protein
MNGGKWGRGYLHSLSIGNILFGSIYSGLYIQITGKYFILQIKNDYQRYHNQ